MGLGTKIGIMDDRRRTPRFDCPEFRESQVNFQNGGTAGRLWGLSRDGLSMELSQSPEVNGQYQVTLTDFNSERKISCEINVVWVRPMQTQNFKCGARIVQMDPADKMDLLDVLYEDWKKELLKGD